ncbi:MAG: AsmA-like C-terminal domain-containing protein, partial [Gammaproteobacteria bacterium]|nr:AsmA-like C-terminal domain-containing protein [Gammaproteobacteria bacterium]
NNTSGSLWDAKTEGHLLFKNDNSTSSTIDGQFRLEDMEMAKLAETFNRPGKITTGKATLEYFYTAEKMDLDSFSGHGSLSIDNADMLPTPLLSKIFKSVGLADNELKATSDATMAFTTKGPLLTINQAYCTNQHGAIVVEPGGTINLQEHALDMHITAIHFRKLGDFIRKLPVLRLFAGFKDKLMRLRIEGQWSDPPSKLIKKEPAKDVRDGVVDFFMQIAQSSGQLTEPMLNRKKDNTEKAK